MTYLPMNLTLSHTQLQRLAKGERIQLSADAVKHGGSTTLHLTQRQITKLQKASGSDRGAKIAFSAKQLAHHNRVHGGGLVSDALNRVHIIQERSEPVSGKNNRRKLAEEEARLGTVAERNARAIQAALDEMINLLPEDLRNVYNGPIWHRGQKASQADLLARFVKGHPWFDYETWAEEQKMKGFEPTEQLYRLQKLEAWSEHKARQDARVKGFLGFLKGAYEAVLYQSPVSLAQVANVLGRVIPGASKITNQIEERLNPDHQQLPFDAVGGIAGKVLNGAVDAAGKVVPKVAGGGIKGSGAFDRILRRSLDKITHTGFIGETLGAAKHILGIHGGGFKPRVWERESESMSWPADHVSVGEWRKKLHALKPEELAKRTIDSRVHCVKIGLDIPQVEQLVSGRGVLIDHQMMRGEHVKGGQLVLLPAEHARKVIQMLRNDGSFKLKLNKEHVAMNLMHAGGHFAAIRGGGGGMSKATVVPQRVIHDPIVERPKDRVERRKRSLRNSTKTARTRSVDELPMVEESPRR